ncbi:MAG: hypothetical protein BZ136_09260 [Methanosphaera sp. rholeuAM74]|nr:MAG: hypothetical protein BZ136_09260 [Methanosphaera sp. rholeuAM74]
MLTKDVLLKYMELGECLNELGDLLEESGCNGRDYTHRICVSVSDSYTQLLYDEAEKERCQIIEYGYDDLRDLDRVLGLYNPLQEKR